MLTELCGSESRTPCREPGSYQPYSPAPMSVRMFARWIFRASPSWIVPSAACQGRLGSVRVLNDRPGFMELETSASGRQLLLVTERVRRLEC